MIKSDRDRYRPMVQPCSEALIIYPDSDGQPIADNTKQFRWIVTIKENLDLIFRDRADVFVAGDLLWYPVEGNPKIRQAPDVLVVLGRPKGDRGSYQQWREGGIATQVVFEILSPGNRLKKMLRKLDFYTRYGVEEYYLYDPDSFELTGLQRQGAALTVIEELEGWVSPLLGIRFQPHSTGLEIYRPDGRPFLSYLELGTQWEAERQRAEAAEAALETERSQRALLAAKLRELGIEPD